MAIYSAVCDKVKSRLRCGRKITNYALGKVATH